MRFFFLYIFLIFAQNIYCVYTLERPRRVLTSAHNLCFGAKVRRKKKKYPCIPQFCYIKVGLRCGSQICFPGERCRNKGKNYIKSSFDELEQELNPTALRAEKHILMHDLFNIIIS